MGGRCAQTRGERGSGRRREDLQWGKGKEAGLQLKYEGFGGWRPEPPKPTREEGIREVVPGGHRIILCSDIAMTTHCLPSLLLSAQLPCILYPRTPPPSLHISPTRRPAHVGPPLSLTVQLPLPSFILPPPSLSPSNSRVSQRSSRPNSVPATSCPLERSIWMHRTALSGSCRETQLPAWASQYLRGRGGYCGEEEGGHKIK